MCALALLVSSVTLKEPVAYFLLCFLRFTSLFVISFLFMGDVKVCI